VPKTDEVCYGTCERCGTHYDKDAPGLPFGLRRHGGQLQCLSCYMETMTDKEKCITGMLLSLRMMNVTVGQLKQLEDEHARVMRDRAHLSIMQQPMDAGYWHQRRLELGDPADSFKSLLSNVIGQWGEETVHQQLPRPGEAVFHRQLTLGEVNKALDADQPNALKLFFLLVSQMLGKDWYERGLREAGIIQDKVSSPS